MRWLGASCGVRMLLHPRPAASVDPNTPRLTYITTTVACISTSGESMVEFLKTLKTSSIFLTRPNKRVAFVALAVLCLFGLTSVHYSTSDLLLPTVPEQYESQSNQRISKGGANATILILCRNSDIEGVLFSLDHVETRFNRRFGYPYTLLNEEPFTEDFKERVLAATESPVEFGLIPPEHWFQSDWIDEGKATAGREKLSAEHNAPYAENVAYRNMCRYNSGFFYRHPLVQKYRWYWRVEPDIQYRCDVNYDPFLFMEENNKTYGFTITFTEYESTIPSLWDTTKEFMALHPRYVDRNNAINFVSEDGGNTYNLCHFWSNFEIGDLDFWRSEAYQKYFDFLEQKGGFYYERWGDAPVHSIAAALLTSKDKIHHFRDIGYYHNPYDSCPAANEYCDCNSNAQLDWSREYCFSKFDTL